MIAGSCGITDSMDMNFSKLWDTGKDRGDWCAAVCEVAKSRKRLKRVNVHECSVASVEPDSLQPHGL